MMKFDINELSEAELIDLNHRVVERLRFLRLESHVTGSDRLSNVGLR